MRSAAGEAAAFDEFVRRHRMAVFRYACAICSQEADAEDVLQQTFVQAWRSAGRAIVRRVRPWLYTIARHALQRSQRRPVAAPADAVSLDELGEAAGFACGTATPERLVAAIEERTVLVAVLRALPTTDREVLVLRELEELSGEETAAVLGLSMDAMKSRLHRARLRFVAEIRRRLPEGTMS